jgi:hypothetical protein
MAEIALGVHSAAIQRTSGAWRLTMDEREFDSLLQSRPFKKEDAMRADARLRRSTLLGTALWGRASDDLHRQLIAPYPEIPSGFDLADFRELQRSAQELSSLDLGHPRFAWFRDWAGTHQVTARVISVGTQQFTFWEARWEVVRRAIEFLENSR